MDDKYQGFDLWDYVLFALMSNVWCVFIDINLHTSILAQHLMAKYFSNTSNTLELDVENESSIIIFKRDA